MSRNDHRITARSVKVGKPWYDTKGRQWQRYRCGVTDHGECSTLLSQRTGVKVHLDKRGPMP